PNANHIFNAIHSSMRHCGSSVYPNGMSFYLATVPRGMHFYHGTGTAEPITGLEWLAFEPTHAIGFAHRAERPPSHHHKREQQVLSNEDPPEHGYLHTYSTAKDLRLLYLDGMSGIKGSGGTMDAQDRILFNDSIDGELVSRYKKIGGPVDDQQRAIFGCQMAKTDWGGRVDGFIRTEAGFEIILCNFERDLEVVRIARTKPQTDVQVFGRKSQPPGGDRHMFLSPFDDLAAQRARVDFDHLVTAYTYHLDLFAGGSELPRLSHVPTHQLDSIKRDIHDLIMTREPSLNPFDWQAIADRIVVRYSDKLQALYRTSLSLETLRGQVETILEPFIDYDNIDGEEIVQRCRDEFIPRYGTPTGTLAGDVVHYVSGRICSTLTSVLLQDVDLNRAVENLRDLVSYLAWTTWSGC
ncbi:hypothetical protein ASPWEDRAFT_73654, partial [Aspergillus wentii DTO 134E9]